jgi:hypothetical protein
MHETNLNSSINPRVKYEVCMTCHNVRNTWLLPSHETSDEQHGLLKLHPWLERVFEHCVLYSHTSEWRTISLASWCTSCAKLKIINIYLLCFIGLCACWMGAFYVGNFTDWEKLNNIGTWTEEGPRKSLHWFGAEKGVKIFSTQGNKTVKTTPI